MRRISVLLTLPSPLHCLSFERVTMRLVPAGAIGDDNEWRVYGDRREPCLDDVAEHFYDFHRYTT